MPLMIPDALERDVSWWRRLAGANQDLRYVSVFEHCRNIRAHGAPAAARGGGYEASAYLVA